jgi:hypothetical protein
VWDGSAGTFTITGDLIATGNIQTNAVTTLKVAAESITKIYSAETATPVGINGTYTSLGAITTNWSSVSAEVPTDVAAIISVNVGNVTATITDTIEFRLKVGSTNYDFYFQDIDPNSIQNQLCTFQILYPTSSTTGAVTVELFARNLTNPGSSIYAYQRAATLLGFKR